MEGLQPEKFDDYQIIEKDNLVFKLIDLENIQTSRVGISPFLGIVSPAYIILKGRKSELSMKYYYYFFISMYYRHIFNNLGGDGVRSSLNYKELLELPNIILSPKIQDRIVKFLDKKCGEIDDLIKIQEQEIEKLEEYKKSIIYEAVTKGLDPKAKMKDSGIEWIGEIPEDWVIVKNKHIFKYT